MNDAAPPLVDLPRYCSRIGYDGSLVPTWEVLAALQAAHIAAIPFEALDPLTGKGVDLDPAAVDAKLIDARRGGYCFEQNSLFLRVLRAIGFDAEGRIARVRWMQPDDAPPTPRTHQMTRVM
ncbi:arylamine N-acetyltransferase, partial [Sphingopyxis sp. KK2]|uniref:arylamine N-acetyltransferase family protein n=1 Tax=Sphingopyxis sp. KK2 TaxID=1855727 RepID=UPI001181B300